MGTSHQTSPENVRHIGGVTMAENHVSKRLPIARKPRRHRVDEGLVVRFLCHADSTHVLQTLWRGLFACMELCEVCSGRELPKAPYAPLS